MDYTDFVLSEKILGLIGGDSGTKPDVKKAKPPVAMAFKRRPAAGAITKKPEGQEVSAKSGETYAEFRKKHFGSETSPAAKPKPSEAARERGAKIPRNEMPRLPRQRREVEQRRSDHALTGTDLDRARSVTRQRKDLERGIDLTRQRKEVERQAAIPGWRKRDQASLDAGKISQRQHTNRELAYQGRQSEIPEPTEAAMKAARNRPEAVALRSRTDASTARVDAALRRARRRGLNI